MPPKVRDLIAQLEQNGFTNRGGNGSHRNFYHRFCSKVVTISDQTGADAQKYQLKQVKEAVKEVKRNEKGS